MAYAYWLLSNGNSSSSVLGLGVCGPGRLSRELPFKSMILMAGLRAESESALSATYSLSGVVGAAMSSTWSSLDASSSESFCFCMINISFCKFNYKRSV